MAKWTVTLDCYSVLYNSEKKERVPTGPAHTVTFGHVPPVRGSEVWCPRCNTVSRVVEAPPQWRTRCLHCTAGRTYDARVDAERAARRHVRRRPTHTVQLKDGFVLVAVWNEPQEAGTLFGT